MSIPRTDTHIHVTYYRLKPNPDLTLEAVVQHCVEAGLERVGLMQHLNEPKHPYTSLVALVHDFRASQPPMLAAVGAELNIIDAPGGVNCTLAQHEVAGFDYVLAGIHGVLPEAPSLADDIEYVRRCTLAAMENAWLDVVAHPWRMVRRSAEQREGVSWEFSLIPEGVLREFAAAMQRHQVACELHFSDLEDFGDPAFERFIDMLLSSNIKLAVASDAHLLEHIGRDLEIWRYLGSRGVGAEQIWFPSV